MSEDKLKIQLGLSANPLCWEAANKIKTLEAETDRLRNDVRLLADESDEFFRNWAGRSIKAEDIYNQAWHEGHAEGVRMGPYHFDTKMLVSQREKSWKNSKIYEAINKEDDMSEEKAMDEACKEGAHELQDMLDTANARITELEREVVEINKKREGQANALRQHQAPIKHAAVEHMLAMHRANTECHCQQIGKDCNLIRMARHYQRLITSVGSLEESTKQLESANARIAKLEDALKPFAEFAKGNTEADEDWSGGRWKESCCRNDRIVDWFGPSDFQKALEALDDKDGV